MITACPARWCRARSWRRSSVMMRSVILSFVVIWLGLDAAACSCAETTLSDARQEFADADVVFEGYILDVEYGELTDCRPGSGPENVRTPLGKFKVVEALKGTENGAVISARVPEYPNLRTTMDCDVRPVQDSCQITPVGTLITDPRFNRDDPIDFHSLEPAWAEELRQNFDSKYVYQWFAFRKVKDDLTASEVCAAFSQLHYSQSNVETVVNEHRTK